MDATQFEAAGLYDPASPTAADRLALLERLAGDGVTLDEMVVADRENRLVALAVDRMVAHRYEGLTLEEVSRRTGTEPELVERAQRALGLPPLEGATYSETSVAAFATAAAFFGADPALQFSRVLGSSVARIVDAAMSLFVTEVVLESTSEAELAQRSTDAAALLLALPETIDTLFPFFVADAVRRLRLTTAPTSEGIRVAVGFVDLVDSTRLSQQLSGPELAGAVGEFESGDFYGPTVNLVSRLTGIAPAGELLGTPALAAAVADAGAAYAFEPAGEYVLRGFADPVEAFSIHRR